MLNLNNYPIAYIVWAVIFSIIGLCFLVYGKKRKQNLTLIIGIVLLTYPIFITNPYIMVLVGAILTTVPFIFIMISHGQHQN